MLFGFGFAIATTMLMGSSIILFFCAGFNAIGAGFQISIGIAMPGLPLLSNHLGHPEEAAGTFSLSLYIYIYIYINLYTHMFYTLIYIPNVPIRNPSGCYIMLGLRIHIYLYIYIYSERG